MDLIQFLDQLKKLSRKRYLEGKQKAIRFHVHQLNARYSAKSRDRNACPLTLMAYEKSGNTDLQLCNIGESAKILGMDTALGYRIATCADNNRVNPLFDKKLRAALMKATS